MKLLSCVIFDLDGTLTRTNELIVASFNHVAQRYLGKSLSHAEVVALFGPPEDGALATLLGERHVPAAMDDLCDFYSKHHSDMAYVHTGIEDVLRYLKERGVTLAIFTGKGRRTTEITLKQLSLGHYFDMVVSGTDVVHHKPHPEGILKVMERFSLHPSEVLMVGDALSDIRASRSAAVKVAGVLWDCYDKERVSRADTDYLFHSVGEMHSWFRSCIN